MLLPSRVISSGVEGSTPSRMRTRAAERNGVSVVHRRREPRDARKRPLPAGEMVMTMDSSFLLLRGDQERPSSRQR